MPEDDIQSGSGIGVTDNGEIYVQATKDGETIRVELTVEEDGVTIVGQDNNGNRPQHAQAQEVNRSEVTEQTKDSIDTALDSVDDPDAKDAIRELAHVVTGDDRFEVTE